MKMENNLTQLKKLTNELVEKSSELEKLMFSHAEKLQENSAILNNDFSNLLLIFVLACFVGYFVVWKVTPALHTPLMSVTNAISGVIILAALIAVSPSIISTSHIIGFLAIILASVNIFGGFIVTTRMLEMFKKKQR